MVRPVAEFIDAYRIWHKVTFQRGRILKTRGDAWRDLGRPELIREPELFYGADGRVPDMRASPERAFARSEVSRFSFPSLHPIRGYDYPETNVAHGWLYRPKNRPRSPVAVLAHGWAHDGVRALERIFVGPLLNAGFAVALPELPFHFRRAPAGTYSGELMVSGDVMLTVEAFRQAAADLCGRINWLRDGATGDAPVGVIGYSLGGYVAGLLACLRHDLDFAVIAAAGDSVVSPILDTGLGANVREDLSWSGMDGRESLERAWGIISPGRLRLRIPLDRVLLVAGVYDRIMLQRSVADLWESWGRPDIRWENEGHYTLLAYPGRVVRLSEPLLSPVGAAG